jgi:hypothetical protein
MLDNRRFDLSNEPSNGRSLSLALDTDSQRADLKL